MSFMSFNTTNMNNLSIIIYTRKNFQNIQTMLSYAYHETIHSVLVLQYDDIDL